METEQLQIPAIPECTLSVAPDLLNIAPLMAYVDTQVKTDADQEIAVSRMNEIKIRKKALEKEFDLRWGNEKRSLKKLLKMITDYEKKILERYITPIISVSDAINRRVIAYWKEREAELQKQAEAEHAQRLADEREKKERAMKLAVTTGDEKAIKEIEQREKNISNLEGKEVKAAQTVRTTSGTLAAVKYWTWKVVDESKIPDEYWLLDEKALNALAKGRSKEPVDVPGVEFYQETRSSKRF